MRVAGVDSGPDAPDPSTALFCESWSSGNVDGRAIADVPISEERGDPNKVSRRGKVALCILCRVAAPSPILPTLCSVSGVAKPATERWVDAEPPWRVRRATGSDGTRVARVRGRVVGRGSGMETGETGRFSALGRLIRVTILGGARRREAVSSSELKELTERIRPLEDARASFLSFNYNGIRFLGWCGVLGGDKKDLPRFRPLLHPLAH